MQFLKILIAAIILTATNSVQAEEQQNIPETVYSALEYILSCSLEDADVETDKLSDLIHFVGTFPADSDMKLKERKGASGAFHSFSINGNLSKVLDYVYNPDIPGYITAPSSLQNQELLTPELVDALRNLPSAVESDNDIRVMHGREREIITPDTNTGGYYKYIQDRLVILLPGPTGPVLISTAIQIDSSEVGKKGCVVGEDKDWNYLYSDETGLNKTGLGWVDSYMYHSDSVIIYVADTAKELIHVGSFKWLNAGWAKMNMVKSSHILNGQKRFSSDFKAVLESPGLPDPQVLEGKYQELLQTSEQELRQRLSPHLQAMYESGDLRECSSSVKNMVSSGEYLQQMSQEEMIRVILLEYVKAYIGKESVGNSVIQTGALQSIASRH